MNDLISRQSILDIVDDLRDRMTVEGYCAMTERVKALPSATCGNLEKPETPQHSEGEAADCNLDCISRQMLLEYIHGEPVGKLLCDKYNLDGLIEQFPSVQPERKTGRWIPCIERLPGKHGEMYLVTISDGAIYSAALQWDINRKRWYLSFLNNGEMLIDYIDDVIAWQPLPEPYREEGD